MVNLPKIIEGSCHCGNVRLRIADRPRWLTSCNCSICRRLGALWGHVERDAVTITCREPTRTYVTGDRMIAFHSCGVCACTTHWTDLDPDNFTRMGVNFRACPEELIAAFEVRRRDGAGTGEFLD